MDSRERRTLAQRRAATLFAVLKQYPAERLDQFSHDTNVKRLMEAWEGMLDVAQHMPDEEVIRYAQVHGVPRQRSRI